MRLTFLLSVQALWAVAVDAYVVPFTQEANTSVLIKKSKKRSIGKRDDDPSDYSWIKRWAAVGDSYAAGIGSGRPLGNPILDQPEDTNWYCSRYDTAWPMIVNDALGPTVEKFFFKACSGDRTGGIYNQIKDLEDNLDLVMLTAGGNDLCLSKLIQKCVFVPSGDSSCESVITIAQSNLNSILKPNIQQLIDALDEKMNDDGVVIYNGYAQFFNTETEDCADQDWAYATLWPGNSGLTIARREVFNDLVIQINNIIKSVVDAAASNSNYKWKIGFSNWDPWVSTGVAGQMCDPSGTGSYPDEDQPDLQFFKPDTNPSEAAPLKRRGDGGEVEVDPIVAKRLAAIEEVNRRNLETELYNSILFNSVNPRAEVKHKLDRRAPSPPGCPGDDPDVDIQPPTIGLPDNVGKNFHPNELGHYTIASFALQTMVDVRAAVLDLEPPSCEVTDKFTCWQSEGSKAYASSDRLNGHYKDFCDSVTRPTGQNGWSFSKKYDTGTPDEVGFLISLADTSTNFDKNECIETLDRIINSCDGNDPKNPMNWKFGGEWVRGDYTYQVNPQKDNRPWPVIQAVGGACKGWYHGIYSSYEIYGYGWSTWDYGQDTLEDEARGCIGGGLTGWKFDYYDGANSDGYEWKATFNTPIWVRQRCFNNNKVQFKAGGFTNGCGGND